MSRPGGNPDLDKHQFDKQYNWDEPCTAQFNIRLPPSLLAELKTVKNYQELVRQAIADLVEEELAIRDLAKPNRETN
jgi:hypothetical protein